MGSRRTPNTSLSRVTGMGSRMQNLFGDFLIKHSTSNEVRGLEDRRTGAPSTEEYTVVCNRFCGYSFSN